MTREGPEHQREHYSLLARPEKRLLVWMARRLPSSVGSDLLSAVGLSAMLVAGLAFWAASWNRGFLFVVVAALAVNWFGDSLDGTVARVRQQQRPRYGFYVDHVIDIVGAVFLIAGIALSDFMTPVVALAFLVGYLAVSAESYLATRTRNVFRMSFLRVGPTELRLILATGTLWLLRDATVEIGSQRYLLFDVGGVAAASGLALAFLTAAIMNTRTLYAEEPLPSRPLSGERRVPRQLRAGSTSGGIRPAARDSSDVLAATEARTGELVAGCAAPRQGAR